MSEKALSQGLGRPALLSLSRAIEANRKQYYEALQEGQQSNKITPWVTWFVNVVLEAQIQAEEQIEFTLKKTRLLTGGGISSMTDNYKPFAACWRKARKASKAA